MKALEEKKARGEYVPPVINAATASSTAASVSPAPVVTTPSPVTATPDPAQPAPQPQAQPAPQPQPQLQAQAQVPAESQLQPTSTSNPASPSMAAAVQPTVTVPLQDDLPIADSIVVKSLNVRQTEIRDVLSGLASQYGINILMAPEVQGPITVNLNRLPLKRAVKLIAMENGYELSVVQGAIKVDKKTAPPPPEPEKPKFNLAWDGNTLSADLEKIPAEQVVRKLVEVTGRNTILESGQTTPLSAYFKNVEWPKALKLICEPAGMTVRERDGIWSVALSPWTGPTTTSSGISSSMPGGAVRLTAKGNLYSLETQQAPLAQVISTLSNQAGIGTVVYGELRGNVTLKVADVPLTKLIQILMRGSEYTFWEQDGIVFIGPHGLQGVNNSRLIVLKHLRVDDAMDLLPPTLTKDAQIKVVKSQNALMVLGSYEQIDDIGRYVNAIDRPVAQILIEALVVDIDMDRIRQYGVDMFLGDFRKVKSAETIYPAVQQVIGPERSQSILSGIPGLRDVVSLPKNFVAKIDALEQEKILKVRSRPQISTLNGSEATITVGQTQYFLLKQETDFNQTGGVTSRTSERFEKIEANVTLTVTPFVTGEGEITCDIVPDFSEPEGSFSSNTPPTLNRRVLKSKVRLRDGETIVLGGLVKESQARTSRQFPLLGSIPVLGWLFKNNDMVNSRSQLLIFVTPHVYYGKDAHVNPNEYLKSATELEK
jgi:type II secretory pathway component GspD/PulD (secretin)